MQKPTYKDNKHISKRAFTLVEILIAIAVIMILFIVLVSKVGTSTDSARKSGVQTDIRSFQVALHQVGIEQSEFSSDLFILSEQLNVNLDEGLMVYVEGTKLKSRGTDPWGTEYELRYTQPSQTKGQIVIVSAGPDIIFDTKDDIASVVTYYESANGDGEHIVISDSVSTDNDEHVCSFVREIKTSEYLNTAGNCKNPATYFYSCICGAKGTTTFNGNKDSSIHINDIRYKHLNVDEESHKKITICNGCSKELNTITESCTFENNTCIYCNGIGHIHNYQDIVDNEFKKEVATCLSGTVYYKSCACGVRSQDTFTADDALGHNYVGTVTKDATCTSAGTCKYSCSRCSSSYTQSIAQSPHSFAKIERDDMIETQATCITPTIYYYSCSNCSTEGTDTFEAANKKTNPTNHVGTSTTKYIELNDTHHTVASQCSSCKSDEHYISSTTAEHVFNSENSCLLCSTHVCKYTSENTGSLKSSATCTSKAVYYYQCIGCDNYSTTDTFEFGDMEPHCYNKEVVNIKYLKAVATCNSKEIYYKSCQCGEQGTEDYIFYFGDFDKDNHINENFKNRYDYVSEQSHLLTIVCQDCNDDVDYYPEQHSFDATNNCTLCQKHVHSFTRELANNSTLKTAATCTSKAIYYYSCIGCDEQTSTTFEYGNMLDHVYNQCVESDAYFVTKATCRTGTTYYYSCKCGAVGSTTFTNNERITDNHEGIEGYVGSELVHSKYTCCQVEKNNHNDVLTKYIVIAATCTTKGTSKYTCDCGYYYTVQDIDVLGHAEVQHLGQVATCTTSGYKDYVTCSRCDYTTYEAINALGHNFNAKVTTATYEKNAATCINKAVYYHSCSNCGLSSKNQVNESTFEFGDYASSVHSAVEKNGTSDRHSYCEWCNVKLSSTHIYNESIAVNPTCTSMGSTKYSCICGYSYTVQNIDATGHRDENNDNKCDVCALLLKSVEGLGDVAIGGIENENFDVEYDPDDGSVTIIPPEQNTPETPPTIPENKLPTIIEFNGGLFKPKASYVPGTYETVPYEYTYTTIKFPAMYTSYVWSAWTITKDLNDNIINTVARDIQLSDIDKEYSTYIVYRFTNENALELNGVLGNSVNIYTFSNTTQDILSEAIYLAAYLNNSFGTNEFHVAKLVNGIYTHQNVDSDIIAIDSFVQTYVVKGNKQVEITAPSTTTEFVYLPGSSLKAEEGMTWNEWLVSEYNTTGYNLFEIKTSNFEDVSLNDVIMSGMDYGFVIYELSGQWQWNANVPIENEIQQNIKFMSNNIFFDTINTKITSYGYMNYDKITPYYDYPEEYGGGSWSSGAVYRIVNFGTVTQEVSKEFYEWFTSNAVPMESCVDNNEDFICDICSSKVLYGIWKLKESDVSYSKNISQNINFYSPTMYATGMSVSQRSSKAAISYTVSFPYQYSEQTYNNGWTNTQLSYINFGTQPQAVSDDFYNWFVWNATQQTTYTISGRWMFNKQINTSGLDIFQNIKFSVTVNGKSSVFSEFVYTSSDSSINYKNGFATPTNIYSNGFVDDEYLYIDFGNEQQIVFKEFYDWLLENAMSEQTAEKDHWISGEWVLNDVLTEIEKAVYDISFTSNNIPYTQIEFDILDGMERDVLVLTYVNQYAYPVYYYDEDPFVTGNASIGWNNEAYKVIDFGEAPQFVSEELYMWLLLNATKK